MLSSTEVSLKGQWRAVGGVVVADATCRRIEQLVNQYLVFVADSPDGWSKLYRDPSDGRLWEHSYPESHVQGGGPPALHCVTPETARQRYPNGV